MDTSELRLGILIIDFINKFSTLLYNQRVEFVTYLKHELTAFDDNFSFIFDNLLDILYYEKNESDIECIINNFIEVYNLDKTNVELCIKCCNDYLNDYMVNI